MPEGCRFRPRCPYAAERCLSDPPLREVAPGQASACHFAPWSEWPAIVTPPPRGSRMSRRPLMEVRDLAVQFKARGGVARALDGVSLRVAARRDPRRGGRVGLRQVDPGARDARPAVASAAGAVALDGQAVDGKAEPGRAAPARADDLPGSLPDAEPAPAGGRDRRPSRWSFRGWPRDEHDGRVRRALEDVGLEPERFLEPLPAPALGRPAPARGDRGGAGARARGADLRRAGLDARRLRARPDPRRPGRARSGAATWRCSSSPTTSASRGRSATGSRSCTWGGWSSRGRRST